MRINFVGKTNKDYLMINAITFQLPSGSLITVDRDDTDYTIKKDGDLSMTWHNCYIWNIDGYNIVDEPAYMTDDCIDLLRHAEIVDINLEDDADDDYIVRILGWEAC